jgi:CBS domain-containing protein
MTNLTARDVMVKKKIITISPKEKIALADLIMTRSSVGALPVVENKKIVGIITQRDIMLARGYEIGGLLAKDLMTRELITVKPDTPVKEIIDLMVKKRIERIPVVKDGKFQGLVVHGKILKAMLEGM